jgi:hypothetical protein
MRAFAAECVSVQEQISSLYLYTQEGRTALF